ncbi:MAG: IS1595 family transposase [Alphaproteobacteria bacterium]|nr:IS1595 family transposase [Alphaproteobacteria bacterium]
MSIVNNPIFNDSEKAREWLEALLWADGPVCPKCGVVGAAYALRGKAHRPGLYKCKGCDSQFTVTVGTIFERSHIPLNKWLLAFHLMVGSKKGVSAHQIHRMLDMTYKSAWFMCHRIREAMRDGKLPGQLGGQNKVVEADETYIGGKAANRKHHVPPKEAAFALVERDGAVRSFHVPAVNAKTLRPVLAAHVDRKSYLMTDDAPVYVPMGRDFSGHGAVNHSIEEYVRGGFWHTNTVENYFSILKRGIVGTYHHVSQQHLKRYLGEFDFRYNMRVRLGFSDMERMTKAALGVVGKRLTYRRTCGTKEGAEASAS